MKNPHLYIVTDHKNFQLQVGVSEDLAREIYRLKQKAKQLDKNETTLHKLVWHKSGANIDWVTKEANRIEAEPRESKIDLIRRLNPQWLDLYQDII